VLREFFRLMNADSNDADMIEHDSTTLEGAYEALDVGVRRAQLYLIGIGQGEGWVKTGTALTVTGTDPNRYSSLPADFLRLDSDPEQERSGLVYSTGLGWGREVHPDDKRRVSGSYYWVEWNAPAQEARIRYARSAAVPAGILPEYYYAIGTLADATTVEMRDDDRPLIPAYAADYAMSQSWFAGGDEQRAAISRNLQGVRDEAYKRGRLTRRARKIQTHQAHGRWIV
jgi:hypothetical protein